MSLSSFLLKADKKKSVAIDKGLDDLFQSTTPQAGPSTSSQAINAVSSTGEDSPVQERKRRLSESVPVTKVKKSKIGKEKESVVKTVEKKRKTSKSRISVEPTPDALHTGSDENGSEEPHPVPGDKKAASSEHGQAKAENGPNDEASESDDDEDPSQLVHESLAKGVKSRSGGRSAKAKFIPSDETLEQRNARTVFVGNVPVETVKSRPLQKQFKRHILSFVPTAKIESVRFRSVAFQNPTSKLPTLEEGASDKATVKKAPTKEKDGREHDRERAATWRATKGQDEEEAADAGKNFLTPKEKKRIAFINQEIHSGVDAVNAYVVFAHPIPATSTRPANVPSLPPCMDPYETSKLAVERCDGSVFMERTIRVDRVGYKSEDGNGVPPTGLSDPKATVFVGNLDFASKEEDLRVFFEGLVSAERGPPGEGEGASSDEDEEDEEEASKVMRAKKPRTWVKRVRIIRDKDTQLGKGFAYVQFSDRECVDEVLAMEESRLKFAKRKLRVQRCKTVPGAAKVIPKYAKPALAAGIKSASAVKRPRPSMTPAPKGDPSLGTKISHLPKEERKKVKAADADRIARRMAKKKAKLLAEKGVKSKVDKERVRKRPGEKWAGNASKDKKKGRVRSGNALAKMNTKK